MDTRRRNFILAQLESFEQGISYQIYPDLENGEIVCREGNLPVLLSAPHSAAHTREGKHKEEDEFTGAYVLLLSKLTGAHAIYSNRKSKTDPNKAKNVPYKSMISEIHRKNKIEFVLDIHGASQGQNFALALGTMKGESCPNDDLNRILAILSKHGFTLENSKAQNKIDLNNTFSASSQETVTRYIWENLHIPVMQVEINAALRIVNRKNDASQHTPYTGDREGIERTINALQEIITEFGGRTETAA